MPDYFEYLPVTIAINESLSSKVRLAGYLLCGIIMPAAWDAASLTFQNSIDDTNFANIYDSAGAEKTVTAAAARHIMLDPSEFAGIGMIKVRSGTSGAAVNQTAARTIYLVVRPA
jgi:hypothetical protein